MSPNLWVTQNHPQAGFYTRYSYSTSN